jgi:hypothetical protein
MNDNPVGQRFSHIYEPREKVYADHPKMRTRIASFVQSQVYDLKQSNSRVYGDIETSLYRTFKQELGIAPPYTHGWSFEGALTTCTSLEFLDAVTVYFRFMSATHRQFAANFLTFCRRVMTEERMGYRIDDAGGVHYMIDVEYEKVRTSTIAALQEPRFKAVATEFEQAISFLDPQKRDTKAAVRSAFEAVEILFKLLFADKGVSRLGPAEVDRYLKPQLKELHSSDPVAATSAALFADGMSSWINSAQQYRHGQMVEESAIPPLNLAVAFIAQGALYLRWLAALSPVTPAKSVN